jgi:PII-like signaling protein
LILILIRIIDSERGFDLGFGKQSTYHNDSIIKLVINLIFMSNVNWKSQLLDFFNERTFLKKTNL